jgi:hypothetical protein
MERAGRPAGLQVFREACCPNKYLWPIVVARKTMGIDRYTKMLYLVCHMELLYVTCGIFSIALVDNMVKKNRGHLSIAVLLTTLVCTREMTQKKISWFTN